MPNDPVDMRDSIVVTLTGPDGKVLSVQTIGKVENYGAR